MKKLYLYAVVISILLFRCAPSRYVVPLNEKEHAVTATFGGPMIGFSGAVIPVPLTSVGYGYGLDSSTTLYGNLHTTSLLYGTIQTDIGVCWSIYQKKKFGISGNLGAQLMFDKWERNFRAWPTVDFNAYRFFRPSGSFYYFGIDNWIELSKQRAHNQEQQVHLLMNPHVGIQWKKQFWSYQLESKWILPYVKNEPNVVDYKGIAGSGALGVYFGVYRKF
ncbi:MAG: hypothetical protein Fur0041_06090 [Bacteroidia bacterium]